MHLGSYVKCHLPLSDFEQILISPTEFSKSPQYKISKKISPIGAETDRHVTNLWVTFRNLFTKLSKENYLEYINKAG
jgi:hypothetical protein